MLVLASRSPRRIELLRHAGLEPVVDPADIDESALRGESPRDYAGRIAGEKLRVVSSRHPAATVVAADTTVDAGGTILGQPVDDADARRMITLLSGTTHLVHTAVAATVGGQVRTCLVTSRVTFRRLGPERVEWYVATGEPRGKAGAYAVQGLGLALVAGVHGSLTNVIGLPVPETLALLVP